MPAKKSWVIMLMGHSCDAAFKSRPDAEIAAHLGEVHWSLGNHEKAGTIWREGLLLKAGNETLLETLKQFKFKP